MVEGKEGRGEKYTGRGGGNHYEKKLIWNPGWLRIICREVAEQKAISSINSCQSSSAA